MRDNLITEEEFNNTKEIEYDYLKLAENLIDQLAESTQWKCNEFDSQKMLAMFLKKNMPKLYKFTSVDDNAQHVVLEKVKPQYPKTYEECCDVLKIEYPYFKTEEDGISASTYKNKLIGDLKQLLICRDAYWKLYGEQTGLGKPWEPDWDDGDEEKYCIEVRNDNELCDITYLHAHRILAFPTMELLDIFGEYFKDLIEECKELL